jgi:K+ transporter
MVDADAPASLQSASRVSNGLFTYDPNDTFYIFPKELPSPEAGKMPVWQKRLFSFLVRNVVLPDTFRIPADQLIVYFAYVKA